MSAATQQSYGRIMEIILDGVRTGSLTKIYPATQQRSIPTDGIPVVFPYHKKVTLREDLANRLKTESKFKAYTCRSYYIGAMLQIILQRLGKTKLMKYVMSRPDLQEALFHGKRP